MWTISCSVAWALLSLLFVSFPSRSTALFSNRSTDKCGPGEYWCQDRCGSDAYGDTCCSTPDGQHNLCGAGTICCVYGCCPAGTTCNAVGGCDPPGGQSLTGGNVTTSMPGASGTACPSSSQVTSTTTLTESYSWMAIIYLTTTLELTTCSGTTIGLPSTSEEPSGTTLATASFATTPGTTLPGTTWVGPSGEPIVSSLSVIIINGTATIPVPSVTAATTVTTDNHTFTFFPPTGGPTGGTTGLTATTGPPESILTTTGLGGQTIISSGTITIIETSTGTLPSSATTISASPQVTTLPGGEPFTLPTVTAPTTITTSGTTITVLPPPTPTEGTSGTGGPSVTTLPNGESFTLPSVTAPTIITTGGATLTVLPSPSLTSTTGLGQRPSVTTLPDGETFTLPSVTTPTTITTGGATLTVLPLPSQATTSAGQQSSVITLPDGKPFTFPNATGPTTITTDGATLTLFPTTTASTTESGQQLSVITLPNGQPFTIPSVTRPSTITTGGTTLTLVPTTTPPSSTTASSSIFIPIVTTLPDGKTFTLPSATQPTTFTTGGATITILPPLPRPTGSVTVLPDGATFTYPCVLSPLTTVFDGFTVAVQPGWPCTGPTTTAPASATTSTDQILTTFTTWPSGSSIIPVTTTVEPPSEETNGHTKSTCKLWFFTICISWEDIHIGGWEWDLPPGVYPPCLGPGSCPPIKWPDDIHVSGSIGPWPSITVGNDHKLTFAPKPSDCITTLGTLGFTTTSYAVTSNPTTTQTTYSTVLSTTVTYPACEATSRGATTTLASTTAAACTLVPTQTKVAAREAGGGGAVLPRQIAPPPPPPPPGPDDINFSCEQPSTTTVAIYMKGENRGDPSAIKALLDKRKQQNGRGYAEIRSAEMEATFFFYGYEMHSDVAKLFGNQTEVAAVVEVKSGTVTDFWADDGFSPSESDPTPTSPRRDTALRTNHSLSVRDLLQSRAVDETQSYNAWERSQVSCPRNQDWGAVPGYYQDNVVSPQGTTAREYKAFWDASYGRGATLYIVDHDYRRTHNEFSQNPAAQPNIVAAGHTPKFDGTGNAEHGTTVASAAVGYNIGFARNARWKFAAFGDDEHSFLDVLRQIRDDVSVPVGYGVVSITTGVYDPDTTAWIDATRDVIQSLINDRKMVVVAAVGHGRRSRQQYEDSVPHYPARFKVDGTLPDMVLVGGSDKNGRRLVDCPWNPATDTYAPGGISLVAGPSADDNYIERSGSSLASPRVAALAAYFRVLPTRWAVMGQATGSLVEPRNVKALITYLHRKFPSSLTQDAPTTQSYPQGARPERVNVVWNGQNLDNNCFNQPGGGARKRQDDGSSCPLLPSNLQDLPPEGTLTNLPPNAPDPPDSSTAPASSTTTSATTSSTTTPTTTSSTTTSTAPASSTSTSTSTSSSTPTTTFTPSPITLTNLPTLPTTTLSCASTSYWTQCIVGGNSMSACVSHPVCVSPPTPTPTTTTTSPPPPPPGPTGNPTHWLYIVFEDVSQPALNQPPVQAYSWIIFFGRAGDKYDSCNTPETISQSVRGGAVTLGKTGMPPSFGRFKFYDTTCQYDNRGNSDVGELVCGGGVQSKCRMGDQKVGKCLGSTYQEDVVKCDIWKS